MLLVLNLDFFLSVAYIATSHKFLINIIIIPESVNAKV